MKRARSKKPPAHDWRSFREDERPVQPFSPHGHSSLALAYANTYHLGMSSLALHRVYELVHQREGWSAERFFLDGQGMPRSVETDSALDRFGAVAFSVSFEEDYVNLLAMLRRAGIPLRREERRAQDPVVVMGGAAAAINPLPMSAFIDVFPLGAAENVLPDLLAALEEEEDRWRVLERLAHRDGFYVPAFHRPEEDEDFPKLKKLDLSAEQMRLAGHLPTTAVVTPRTELAEKFLVEMSRGCPEKCKYCWATFGMGTFRWHPTDHILASFDRARAVTDQLGFVATAVGDHPEIERILWEANRQGFRTSVSSVRIPAVTEGVLAALHASGDRSITLAPETGTDELRRKLNKPIPNQLLLDKIRLIFRSGFTQLKLYFLVGCPGETWADVEGILDLAAEARAIMLEELAPRGIVGQIHLGTNILIPKPYTPWQRSPMEDPKSLKAKVALLQKGAARLPNVSLSTMSIRQAIWQSYISKAGSDGAEALVRVAHGESLSRVLRELKPRIHPVVFEPVGGRCRWHFLRQASVPAAAPATAA
jgi:radical SAM superfamily enzyme YgiQ (UPF0313 family)